MVKPLLFAEGGTVGRFTRRKPASRMRSRGLTSLLTSDSFLYRSGDAPKPPMPVK